MTSADLPPKESPAVKDIKIPKIGNGWFHVDITWCQGNPKERWNWEECMGGFNNNDRLIRELEAFFRCSKDGAKLVIKSPNFDEQESIENLRNKQENLKR